MEMPGNISIAALAMALAAFVFQTFATKDDVKLIYDRLGRIESMLIETEKPRSSTESKTKLAQPVQKQRSQAQSQ